MQGTSAGGLLVGVPWHQTNKEHLLRLSLLDADGKPVLASGGPDTEPAPVALEGKLAVGRPPGLPPGTEIEAPFVVQFPAGLPIDPGHPRMLDALPVTNGLPVDLGGEHGHAEGRTEPNRGGPPTG